MRSDYTGWLAMLAWGLVMGVLVATPVSAEEAAADAPQNVKLGSLTVSLPSAWESKPSASQMRLGQFVIPAAEGDPEPGELVVFYFGKGGAGSANANVDRWIQQFVPQGRTVKRVDGKSKLGDYTLVDLTGTYKMPVGPPIQQQTRELPQARVINVMLKHADGPLFLKLAGPQKTVDSALQDFRQAFDLDASREQEQQLPEGS